MEARLARVEEQIKAVADDMIDVKTSLKDIAASLKTIAVLEVKHDNMSEAVKRAFKAIDKVTERVDAIEKALPYMRIASSWVFKAVLFVMGILGATALGVVLRGLIG